MTVTTRRTGETLLACWSGTTDPTGRAALGILVNAVRRDAPSVDVHDAPADVLGRYDPASRSGPPVRVAVPLTLTDGTDVATRLGDGPPSRPDDPHRPRPRPGLDPGRDLRPAARRGRCAQGRHDRARSRGIAPRLRDQRLLPVRAASQRSMGRTGARGLGRWPRHPTGRRRRHRPGPRPAGRRGVVPADARAVTPTCSGTAAPTSSPRPCSTAAHPTSGWSRSSSRDSTRPSASEFRWPSLAHHVQGPVADADWLGRDRRPGAVHAGLRRPGALPHGGVQPAGRAGERARGGPERLDPAAELRRPRRPHDDLRGRAAPRAAADEARRHRPCAVLRDRDRRIMGGISSPCARTPRASPTTRAVTNRWA